MIQRFEGQFRGAENNELFFQVWKPDMVRGSLVITHGLAEHSECYHPLAKALSEDGWQVFGWDLRGHGRSEGKRGFVMDVSAYIKDLACFVEYLRVHQAAEVKRLVLFGHSLGGLVTTRFVQDKAVDCAAVALSSPLLGLGLPVPKFKEILANVAMKWIPTLTMFNEIRYSDLTHDSKMIESYKRDTLRHDKISPGLFLSMVANFPLALAAAPKMTMPVLMQVAGDDRIVSSVASQTAFKEMPNSKNKLIVYPESYHEIFNDLDRETAMADLKNFINPFLGA